jgi:hypothetical protein
MGTPDNYVSKVSGYVMSDLNASQRFSAHVDGVLQLQNLTNHYSSEVGVNRAVIGRQTKVGMRVRY